MSKRARESITLEQAREGTEGIAALILLLLKVVTLNFGGFTRVARTCSVNIRNYQKVFVLKALLNSIKYYYLLSNIVLHQIYI